MPIAESKIVSVDRGTGRDAPVPFTPEGFRSLVEEVLRTDYSFARFDEDASSRAFYLRHDVDLSPLMAHELGRIEEESGVTGNFFFQLNADTYNILDPSVIEVMESLRGMGHLVGLHIDGQFFSLDEASIVATLDWFHSNVTTVDQAVSFHRPTEDVLGRTYEGFVSAYAPQFFEAGVYLSDSRRDPEFVTRLRERIEEGASPIQLLLHPGWWFEEDSLERFAEFLLNRRQNEVRRYLLENVGAVFEGVISSEDRASRL